MKRPFPSFHFLVLPLALLVGLFDYTSWRFVLSTDTSTDSEDNAVPLVAFLLISVGIDTFFVLVGFGTPNEATTQAYLAMIYGSMIALLFLAFYFGDDIEPLPFAKNPGMKWIAIAVVVGFVILLLNIVATSLLSLNLFPSGFGVLEGVHYNSILFVPKFFSANQTGSTSTLDNMVFEIMLTAPGEEGLKAALLYGMYIATRSEAISVVFSTAVWASFHTILVNFTWIEVALAFASGIIMYASWKKSGSILVPIIEHGVYDASIVGLSSF
jgi:membrane protease YdiL (CAAX protease family)